MLYKSYADSTIWMEKDNKTGENKIQNSGYTSFINAAETLFWGLFGMAGLENTELITVHYKDHSENKTTHHLMTEVCGKVLYGGMSYALSPEIRSITNREIAAYSKRFKIYIKQIVSVFHIVANVVLLNIIVAMMTNSATDIFANQDIEWKFGRTRVRLSVHLKT